MNLDDPDHRRRFIHKLTLSCEQAGMTVSDGLLALILTRITPRVLIELREVCRRPPPTANLDREDEQARRTEDRRVAEKLLRDPGVLSRVEEAMEANGYAGDFAPAMLAYVALTSRLLRDERPLSLAIVGDAAAGKNATINAALALVPRDAVYEFTASSPTALLYTGEDFRNRVVIFKEADSIPDRGPTASAIRALVEENILRYEVTIRAPGIGTFETRRIDKPGPTGLITTSTRSLSPELHSRLLPVPVVDDRQTTYKVICMKGDRVAGVVAAPDLEPFLALQRRLAIAKERRVTVPFGWALARAMSTCSLELRARRDFERLIVCIKTIAFIHQRRRRRAADGKIEAAMDDYQVAQKLLFGSFAHAAAEGITAVIRETVEKIGETEAITREELGRRLGRPKQTVSWRVKKALDLELLTEVVQGRSRLLRRNRALP